MSLTLTRIDPAQNMARFYKLDVQPTLFGEWSLVREWGRLGQSGRVQLECYETRGQADLALAKMFRTKAQRGYVLRADN